MNTIHRRSVAAIAFAAFVMTTTAACGSETAVAPANISDPVEQAQTQPPVNTQECSGSPRYAEWACDTEAVSNSGSADERRPPIGPTPQTP